eukprot:355309_1
MSTQSPRIANRKPIATVHLIANVIFNHFKDRKCDIMKHESKTLTAESILSNIHVMGGALRDILLNNDINDVDILIDTQKLNQMHLNHLNKYHSTLQQQSMNSTCIFWKLYLQKFENANTKLYCNQTERMLPNNSRVKIGYFQTNNADQEDTKEPFPDEMTQNTRHILDANYMLNSKYFTDIISDCDELKNVINVTIYAKDLFRLNEIEINKDIYHNNINLKGQSIDFLDAVKRNANMNIIKKYEQLEFKKLNSEKYCYSDRKYEIKDNCNKCDGSIPIAMDIYDISAMEAILQADLSINMLCIDFLNVLMCKEFNWKHKIKGCTLVNDYDVKQDFNNKILTHPYLDQTVLIQRPKYHFFRIIKMYIRLGCKWTIDVHLISVTKKYFYLWLDDDDFWDDCYEDGYPFILWNLFDRNRYSPSNASELYLMLNAFDMFDINEIFVGKLKEIEGFMAGFLKSLKTLSNDMIDVYGKFGYPTEC